ncbi:MAG: ABC transporter permease [Phycisphaerales bacterium]|nr:ABC transporter permease [Phycisphaerales bacterium]
MILQTTTVARNTFVEAVRQPIYLIVLLLAGALQIFSTWSTAYSMGYTDSAEVSKDNKLLLDIGLATIFVAGMLLSAFIATAVVSREIETKTVLTVVSKPISRTAVVLGKYLGVAGAIVLAVVVMTAYLLLAIRHGVMSTAADELDMPVILFSTLAVFLALGVSGWCNFYYGWSFPQAASLLLVGLIVFAYLLTLVVGSDWQVQSITADLKPQILVACTALLLALLVLSALATAASTRLGQVMTIVVCAGVFMIGLLSNYMIGRHAYQNRSVGVIEKAEPLLESRAAFDRDGDVYEVLLKSPPKAEIAVGSPFYFGANPNGFRLAGRALRAEDGSVRGVVVSASDVRRIDLRLEDDPSLAQRPPEPGDQVFLTPTEVNPWAAVVHAVIPNFQHYWLVDAVSQNSPVPATHLERLAGYAGTQIVMFLTLGVVLFQRRDVG